MSLPRELANLRKQFYFSLFYTTTVVFAFMNTVIYWFITRPHKFETAPGSDPNDDDGSSDEELWIAGKVRASGEPCKQILMATDRSELPVDILDQSVISLAKAGSRAFAFSTCF
jgi:hypothetical protein